MRRGNLPEPEVQKVEALLQSVLQSKNADPDGLTRTPSPASSSPASKSASSRSSPRIESPRPHSSALCAAGLRSVMLCAQSPRAQSPRSDASSCSESCSWSSSMDSSLSASPRRSPRATEARHEETRRSASPERRRSEQPRREQPRSEEPRSEEPRSASPHRASPEPKRDPAPAQNLGRRVLAVAGSFCTLTLWDRGAPKLEVDAVMRKDSKLQRATLEVPREAYVGGTDGAWKVWARVDVEAAPELSLHFA